MKRKVRQALKKRELSGQVGYSLRLNLYPITEAAMISDTET